MILEANRLYIIEKLDALNGTIETIQKQKGETEFSQSMHKLLVSRLEKERDRLLTLLPMMSAHS